MGYKAVGGEPVIKNPFPKTTLLGLLVGGGGTRARQRGALLDKGWYWPSVGAPSISNGGGV